MGTTAAEPPPRTSERLRLIAAELEATEAGPTVGELSESLGRVAYGLLLLIFALALVIPGPPGFGALFGTPMIVLGIGMARGKPYPSFPRALADRRLPPGPLRAVLLRAVPVLQRLERWLRPRGLLGLRHAAHEDDPGGRILEIATGVLVTLLALLLLPPIPFTNAPLGAAAVVLALGLMERDAVATTIGAVLSLAASAFTVALSGGFIAALAALFS
ncbi:MAG TPA: exopolysaccharide biosynthesis protein [Azospirillaceae bacterium]|nr:exopolysaccharide biosynthesis protein [Azospirillaceae bacterium]